MKRFADLFISRQWDFHTTWVGRLLPQLLATRIGGCVHLSLPSSALGTVRAKLSTHKDYEYVVQLEEFEDRILRAFTNAVSASGDPAVREISERYMPEVTRDHDEMRTLKLVGAH